MTNAAKKQRNREYYLKNRERILTKAKARKKQKSRGHLEIVPALNLDNPVCSVETVEISEKAELVNPTAIVETFRPASARFLIGETRELDSLHDGSASSETVEHAEIPPASEDGYKLGTSEVQKEKKLKTAEELSREREIPLDSEKKSGHGIASRLTYFCSNIPPSFMLRLLLVVGLTILMTAMQVAFYREHDILPGYAIPLALASEAAFLSLVTMKFSRGLEWLRIMIHVIFFGYLVSALSFHVYAKSRAKVSPQQLVAVPETIELRDQLKQAERSLEVATKGRAWKNMEIFGAEVSRLRELINQNPNTQVLGTSLGQTIWIEAALLILLRALLLAASALNALRLRDQLCEIADFKRDGSLGP